MKSKKRNFTIPKALINISKVFFGQVISKAVGFITLLMIIRNLHISDYAQYTFFTSLASFTAGVISSGISHSTVRFSAEYISFYKVRPFHLYFLSFLSQSALYLALGIFFITFSDSLNFILFGNKAIAEVFYFGIIFGFSAIMFDFIRSIYWSEENFNVLILLTFINNLLVLAAITLLSILDKLNFTTLAFCLVGINLTLSIFMILFTILTKFHITDFLSELSKTKSIFHDFISASGWLILYFLILSLFSRLDIFMLSHFSTEEEIANYGVAFRYYSFGLLSLSSIHTVLLPKFSKIDFQDIRKHKEFISKWIKASIWIVLPIILFDLFGKPFFVFLNGKQYERAFYIFIVFSFGLWLSLMFSSLVNVLMSRKKFKFLFMLSLGAFVINFVGN